MNGCMLPKPIRTSLFPTFVSMQSGYYKLANDSEQRWQTKHIVACVSVLHVSCQDLWFLMLVVGPVSFSFYFSGLVLCNVHNTVAQILSNRFCKRSNVGKRPVETFSCSHYYIFTSSADIFTQW